MNRLTEKTTQLKVDGRTGLVAFLTAGYPDSDIFRDSVLAADAAGCDVIEIGIPFSDPIADGPTIQASSSVALKGGMTLKRALALAAELRPLISAELVFMSYINPIFNAGLEQFASDAARSGVSGVILPDVSFEESSAIRTTFTAAGIDYVDLVAPTSSDQRIAAITAQSAGFVYLVSLTGVTGARANVPSDLPEFVKRVRAHVATPAYVGFGISSPDQAAEVARSADGVIIGSKLIRLMEDGDASGAPHRVGDFLSGVRTALDNASGIASENP